MTRPLVTVIAPTCGRPSLHRMLVSIRDQAPARACEILVVGDTFAGDFAADIAAMPALCAEYGARYLGYDGGQHCVGQPQRQAGMAHARGQWLMWSQDDSWWRPGAWSAIRAALQAGPREPRLFRVRTQWGFTVWQTHALTLGNCDADGIAVPNEPARLGAWGLRYEGDYDFLCSTVDRWDGRLHYEDALIAEAEPIAARRARVAS